jgi:hypothetical protein
MKLTFILPSLFFAAFLAACGGGGSDAPSTSIPAPAPAPPATPVLSDKYTGTWKSCMSNGFLRLAVITKNSDKLYTVDILASSHPGGFPCAGQGTPIPGESGTVDFKIVGTKTVPDLGQNITVVDKTTDLDGGDKDILAVKDGIAFTDGTTGTLLYLGNASSGKDADGFPNALDIFSPFRKQ